MKNILKMLSAVLLSAMFVGCSSLGLGFYPDEKTVAEYQNAVGTPENSVVFYGQICFAKSMSFSQMDPDFPPDYQEITGEIFISKPVAPGSTYVLEDLNCEESTSTYRYIWNYSYSLQTSINPLIINVPKEPGLYYIGVFDGRKLEEGKKAKTMRNSEKYESYKLANVLKLYKGTVWEETINKKIEELKNEK
ncbi:hypothetical protein [Treponema zioleckii]|uniref:hypothetical protein n=1 Tax=Treponema zioleckii TaxID=331680 RepID=UPI00168B4F25|nr:hypothetical protein [Treponema zioleckii]